MRDLDEEAKDVEGKKYSYDFDARIRRYAMRTFYKNFQLGGSALELGCHKGDFTRLLMPVFDSLTVVEGSKDMAEHTSRLVGSKVLMVNSFIEDAFFGFGETFDNIFLINVLEHTDDPVLVLRKIRDWLPPTGRLFILVPNANAASRQIAVRMGILPSSRDLTKGEYTHGHRRVYAFDTLERDAEDAGLFVKERGGIFFKALANYQFDALLEKGDVVTEEYMEACYKLGFVYPDLCASLYLVCGRRG
jgi:SAM-dependent methyltransferase